MCIDNNIIHNIVNPHYNDYKTLSSINNYSKYVRNTIFKTIRDELKTSDTYTIKFKDLEEACKIFNKHHNTEKLLLYYKKVPNDVTE